MKPFNVASLFVLCMVGMIIGVRAQSTSRGPAFAIKESTYEFGSIRQDSLVSHVFTYKNAGDQPLILSQVKTSCGCTAPDWSRDPVRPGGTGQLTIRFNSAGKMGKQNKTIAVYSNAAGWPALPQAARRGGSSRWHLEAFEHGET